MAAKATVKVTQTRSAIGRKADQRHDPYWSWPE